MHATTPPSRLQSIRSTSLAPRGMAIIEVLIAIVVFAFGMLSLAGLQVAALKYQKSAWSRSGAAMLTTDIVERMRANMPAVLAGNYTLSGSYEAVKATPPAASSCDPRADACTAAQMAANDIAAWANLAASEMPAGAATLTGSMADGFLVTVMWNDKNMRLAGGGLEASPICSTTRSEISQSCCPGGTPNGIRCTNSVVRP